MPISNRRLIAALLASSALSAPALGQQLPAGGSVAAGSVVITSPGSQSMSITQSTQSAIVNWQSFSVGAGSRVDIHQPSSTAAMLNRVTGSTPSTIAGQLNANGQVFLVNPNGIAITKSGTVNTGAFVASTLGISDDDFMSGKRQFSGNGNSASVRNRGTITIGHGGYAALLGGKVSNSGTISVPAGKVALGAGEIATLDVSGDGFLQVGMPSSGGKGTLIRNSGSIRAGYVEMQAATARESARRAINLSGVVEASNVGGRSGAIVLGGGSGGAVRVTGKVTGSSVAVSGRNVKLAGNVNVSGAQGGKVTVAAEKRAVVSGAVTAVGRAGKGGVVQVTGETIALKSAAIDVSGTTGGGSIEIGGGYQGSGPLPHARSVSVDTTSTIKADATNVGNGGNIVIWSDSRTDFAGLISALGGPNGGDGGNAEVSSKGVLGYTGFADLKAAHGRFGTLLLDPYNVTISDGADANQSGFTATGDDSVINAGTLMTALGSANVTISTGAGGTQDGDITVAAPISWSANTTLTLSAYRSINVNADITVGGNIGGLAFVTNNGGTGGYLTFNNGAAASFTGTPNAGQTLSINGNAYTLVYSMAQLDAIDAVNSIDGSAVTGYGAGNAGSYALATNVDAAGITYTRALVGDQGSPFTGHLEGLGHTISNLTINAPTEANVGLIGYQLGLNGGVANLGLRSVAVTGASNVGGLVGSLLAGLVYNSYVTGSVSGSTAVGGMLGRDQGTARNSYADVAVTGVENVGGLSGIQNTGARTYWSYALGPVTGQLNTGGLVGNQASANTRMEDSYATGRVNGVTNTGGLVGNSVTSQSFRVYATGGVTGTTNTGGLVGQLGGYFGSAFSTGSVYGRGENTGGLIGLLTSTGTLRYSYSSGAVVANYINADLQYAFRESSGGLIGFNDGGDAAYSYWDTDASGRTIGIGIGASASTSTTAGLTTAQLQGGGATGLGADFAGGMNGLYPYLSSLFRNGVDVVTGRAFTYLGGSPMGPSEGGAGMVSIVVDGARFGEGSTGFNGYYYIFGQAGSLAAGRDVLVYTRSDNGGPNVNGATPVSATGTSRIDSVHVIGGALSTATTAATYSATPDFSLTQAQAAAAAGADRNALAALSGTQGRGIISSASSFTLDQPLTLSSSVLAVQAIGANAPLVVGSPIVIQGSGGLGLSSFGGLVEINSQISVTGSGGVFISGAARTGLTTTGLVFGNGASIDYGSIDDGGVFVLNGVNHRLVYSMAQLDAIDGVNAIDGTALAIYGDGLSGDYALATSLEAGGTTYTRGLVVDGVDRGTTVRFRGRLDGLGNVIRNLTIESDQQQIGLIGATYFNGAIPNVATISNIGLVGGHISGNHSSAARAGGIVGILNFGVLQTSYSTADVIGNVNTVAGGLVGESDSSIVQGSYATGAVTGGGAGGLVGMVRATPIYAGEVLNSYATGPVYQTEAGSYGGGLVGVLWAGSIRNSYATGSVQGPGSVGGLVGLTMGTARTMFITDSFWDTQTSGMTGAVGEVRVGYSGTATGLTTAQFQSGSASAIGVNFAGGTAGLYPYLKHFFPTAAEAVSGIARDAAGNPLAPAGGTSPLVSVAAGGERYGSAYTGANGYYYVMRAAGSRSGEVVAYTTSSGQTAANLRTAVTGNVSGLNLRLGWLVQESDALISSSSALATALTNALDAGAPDMQSMPNSELRIAASGFVIDQPLTYQGTLAIVSNGVVEQTEAIVANAVVLSGTGNFVLTNASNQISRLAANAGSLNFASSVSLEIGSVTDAAGASTVGIRTTGDTTVSASNISISASATVDAVNVTLAATGTFTNSRGSDAVAASGRWLIYSADLAGDTFGNLDSGNSAIFGQTYAALPPGSVTATGNRYIFANSPTVTVTSLDMPSKTYGDTVSVTPVLGTHYTITGMTGIAGAFAAASAAEVAIGAPTLSSAGFAATAGVVGSPYAISVDTSTMTSGYTLVTANTGTISVTPRAITVTADNASRLYGNANVLTYQVGGGGLVNGDSLAGALSSAGTSAGVGSYAITQGSLTSGANYDITNFTQGQLTVTQRPVTVTADNVSRPYGFNNPPLTYTVGGSGFVNGDAPTGALATSATAQSPFGSYSIDQGSLALNNANYAFSFVAGLLSVVPVDMTSGTLGSSVLRDGAAMTLLPLGEQNYSPSGDVQPVSFSGAVPGRDGAGAAGVVVHSDPRFNDILLCSGASLRSGCSASHNR